MYRHRRKTHKPLRELGLCLVIKRITSAETRTERKHAFAGALNKGWNDAADRLRQKSQWKSAQALRPKTALPNSVCIVTAAKHTSHSESWDYAWSSKESDDHREKTMLLITEATPPKKCMHRRTCPWGLAPSLDRTIRSNSLIMNHTRGWSRNYSGPSRVCHLGSVAKRYWRSSIGGMQ